MTLIIITQNEDFFTQIALKKLVEAKGNEIKAIFFLPHYLIFGSSFLMLRYYLTSYGICFVLRVALKRFKKFNINLIKYIFLIKSEDLAYYIKKFSIPVYYIKRIDSKILQEIRKFSPDLIISLSATQLFSEELINLPRKGSINLHSGPLPDYRGLYPTFWQFLNDEKEVGISVHFMNKEIDGGDILLQEKVKVYSQDSLFSLLERVKNAGPGILLRALKMIEDNNVITVPNYIAKGSYYGLPKKTDIRLFLDKGKKFF